MNRQQTSLNIAGRLIIAATIFWIVIGNFLTLDATAGYAMSKSVPFAYVLAPLAQLLLGVVGILILTGIRPLWAYVLFIVFLIPVTFLMHPFWKETGFDQLIDMHSLQGNLLLGGALLLLAAMPSAWPYSLDNWLTEWQNSKFGRVRI